MKVRVTYTVDIDPEVWALEYGWKQTAQVRADVKESAEHLAVSQFAILGVLSGSEQ